MADIRDEHGRPVQLTDELGRPVQLTDEHGVPMHLTGVATTVGSTPPTHTTIGSELHHKTTHDQATQTTTPVAGVGKAATGAVTGGGAPGSHTEGDVELERSTSSSSSSSEDDGEGGRRKKKGFMQKVKEKLPGQSEKEKAAPGTGTKVSTAGGGEQGHEKKGFIGKIKDKLPGSHH